MKIKSLLVMPGKEAQIVKIPASLKFIKALIGENLFRVRLDSNNILIANNDASVEEFNRLFKDNIILGTFLIISIRRNRKVSMKKKNIRKYTNMFKLRKHQGKIDMYKEEYLENYYVNLRNQKLKNAEINKREIFELAA